MYFRNSFALSSDNLPIGPLEVLTTSAGLRKALPIARAAIEFFVSHIARRMHAEHHAYPG